jgi:hypothetical protein
MLAKEILRDQVVLIRKLDLSSEDFPEEEIIAEKRALHNGLAERLNTLKRLGLVDQHEGYDSYFRMVEQLLVEEEAKEAS